jgi:YfiH family protein
VNNIIKTFSDISDWNLALHIWDDEKKVIKNRKILASKLNKNLEDFIYMNQIHWGIVKNVLEKKKIYKCDALVTKEKWIVLSVLVADCVPLLFYDDINEVVWVAHAGWKWTNKKIVQNTINEMLEIWAKKENIKIIIWPSINQCSYEIWEEVW